MPNDVLDLIGSHGMAILELAEAKRHKKDCEPRTGMDTGETAQKGSRGGLRK